MNLNVPLVRQKKGSIDCGLACISMILMYHGINKSTDEIKTGVKMYEHGLCSPQMGIYLLKQGFDVTIILMSPRLFMLKDIKMTRSQILKRLEEASKNLKPNNAQTARYLIEFMKLGGNIIPKAPDASDLKKEISAKRPFIVNLTTNFMNGVRPLFNMHYNVVIGFDKNIVLANDPAWAPLGGMKKYPLDVFLYAVYANTYYDVGNSCFIIAKKKR